MKKEEFLKELEKSLKGLPKEDIDERLEFYSESIDDRVEEGKTEDEAIADIGSVDSVVNQIIKETSLTKIVKEKYSPKRKMSGLEILILILGFPLWFPLLITCGVLVLVAYLLLWILVIVTYAVEIGLVSYGVVGIYAAFNTMGTADFNVKYIAIALLGFGLACLFIFACAGATKVSFRIAKHVLLGIKKKLIRGGKQDA